MQRRVHAGSMTEFGAKQQQAVSGDTWGYDATFKAKNHINKELMGGALHTVMELASGKVVSRFMETDAVDYELINDVLVRSDQKLGPNRIRTDILYVDNEKQCGGRMRDKVPLLNRTGPSQLSRWTCPQQ